MTNLVGIYGAGGAGRGIMPLAREMDELAGAQLVFIDDDGGLEMNGHHVMTFEEFCASASTRKSVAIAIAGSEIRERLADLCEAHGIPLQSVWAKQTMVMDDVAIAEGAIVSPFATFTSNIQIGRCFHANLYSYVEHDCRIGDFVTFAPGVHCNGNVTIGDHAYIGSGAVIRQGITIGARAVVGMGAIVTKDVPPSSTVVGNPARLLVKE